MRDKTCLTFGATTHAWRRPTSADNMLRNIERAAEAIARNPLARRSRDDLLPGLRSALVSPHTVFFRIQDRDVEIVRVLHQRRDFPALFGQRPGGGREDPQ